MLTEAQGYGLKIVDANNFHDPFDGFLNQIFEETKGTNLDRLSCQKIENKLSRIRELVNNSLQK